MKSSLYNTFLSITERTTVIYNALEDKTFILKGNICVDNILSQPSNIRAKLENQGFIVPAEKDEYKSYVDKARQAEDDSKSFHLLINPTLNCNFSCWYCYESHIPSKMPEEVIEKIEKLIDNIYSEGRNLTISFFGGEPMLYYDQVMLPILKYAQREAKKHDLDFRANMTSNGYLLTQQRIRELSLYNFEGAQITLDGDREVHNAVRFHKPNADTFTTIIENIHIMVAEGMTVTLRINCTHDNLESVTRIPEAFNHFTVEEKSRVRTDLHIVWQEGEQSQLYTHMDRAVEVFNSKDIPTAKMEFTGFCYGDKRNSCVVNYNGDIYKCTAIDFHKTPRDGYLSADGRLVWENNSLENRLASKFTNQACKTCRIMPLCHGGCTKQSLLFKNYCIHNHSDKEKDSVVINRILYNSLTNNAHSI